MLVRAARHASDGLFPLGGDSGSLVRDATLAGIGTAHDCSVAAVALAWAIRSGIAIPESGSPTHVKENAVALSLTLTPQELQALDEAHPIRAADVMRSLLDRGKGWLRNFRDLQ